MANKKKKTQKRKAAQRRDDDAAPPGLSLRLDVPLLPIESGDYRARHVDLALTPLQAEGLGSLFAALHCETPAKTANGRFVQTQNDAIRWLLEQIGCEVPKARSA